MSREIKFRAWDKEADVPFMSDVNMMGYQLGNYLSQDRYVVMQYTGLKDKNGVEIWEGDIVRQDFIWDWGEDGDEGTHTGEVVYIPSKGVCMKRPIIHSEAYPIPTKTNQYKHVTGERCEVIGNIYENSDLLAPKHNQASQLAEGV